jgi:hypothetical protein
MSDYAYWTARLSGEDVPHPDTPQPGRYRLPAARKNPSTSPGQVREGKPPKSWPVAIWVGDDSPLPGGTKSMRVLIGGRRLLRENEKDDTGDIPYLAFVDSGWPRCLPVSAEEYQTVIDGGSWKDEHDAVSRSNRAPPANSFAAIADRIDDLAREADALIKAGAAADQATCDQAADLANALGQLEQRADTARKDEKEPHLEAGRAVDAKWKPAIARAGDSKTKLKARVITPYLAELERQRLAAEFEQLTLGTPPDAAAQPKATAGTRGRPVSMREKVTVTITDRAALLAHFASHDEITAVLQTLAERAVRAKMTPPGVGVTVEKVAA